MLSELLSPISGDLAAMDLVIAREVARGLGVGDEIAQHAVGSRGKRLRPAIFLFAARLARGLPGAALDAAQLAEIAAALELIHTASLLHDDVIDEAHLRRAQPSANALFGDRASILVGDVLWGAASCLVVRMGILPLIGTIADAAVATAEGELLELDACRRDAIIDEVTYLRIADGKTAALFSAAARAGAIVARADPRREEALARYGRAVGMAFQLADDAIDVALDAGARSPTARALAQRGGVPATRTLAERYASEAVSHLDAFAASAERTSLQNLAHYAAARTQ